jgi:hypothetical protein
MSNRVNKGKAPARRTRERYSLLRSLGINSVEMAVCSNCERLGLTSCQASPSNSSRCEACVRSGRTGCDVLGPSPEQLENAGRQFQRLEKELDEAEEEEDRVKAKVRRIRRQRRVLADKIQRMVRRGIQSLEELERVEAEEQAEEARRQAGQQVVQDAIADPSLADFPDLGLPFDFGSLSPGTLADLGFAGETAGQAPGSSSDVH